MASLLVDSSSSSCGACGKSANPREKGHYTQLGYGPDNGKPGCGEDWTEEVAMYWGEGRRFHPDLPFHKWNPYVAPELMDEFLGDNT